MLSIWDVAGGRIRARPVSPLRSRKAAQNKSREEARRRRGAPGNDAGSKGKGKGKEGPSSRLFNLTPQHLVVPPREQSPEVAMAPAHLQWSLAEDRWLIDCWYVPSLPRQCHSTISDTHRTTASASQLAPLRWHVQTIVACMPLTMPNSQRYSTHSHAHPTPLTQP